MSISIARVMQLEHEAMIRQAQREMEIRINQMLRKEFGTTEYEFKYSDAIPWHWLPGTGRIK